MVRKWRIGFWTPGNPPPDDGATFGCSSHGILSGDRRWGEPDEKACEVWTNTLEGKLLAGSFNEILINAKSLSFQPSGLILLLAHGESYAERFVRDLSSLLPGIHVAGGVAAKRQGESHGELMPPAKDAIVFAIRGGDLKMSAANLHSHAGSECAYIKASSRSIKTFGVFPDGGSAPESYLSIKATYGVPESDFESFTFADSMGRNLHFRIENGQLMTGADLPEDGKLFPMLIPSGEAKKRFIASCGGQNTLIFGCAGLKTLLNPPFEIGKGSLAAFLLGEVVTLPGKTPVFGNLMLSVVSSKNRWRRLQR